MAKKKKYILYSYIYVYVFFAGRMTKMQISAHVHAYTCKYLNTTRVRRTKRPTVFFVGEKEVPIQNIKLSAERMFCAECDTVEVCAPLAGAPQQPQTLLEDLLSNPGQIALRTSKAETPLYVMYEEAAEFLRSRSGEHRFPPLSDSQRYNQNMSTLKDYLRHLLDERICNCRDWIVSSILSTPCLADTKLSNLCDVLIKLSAQTVNMFADVQ